MSTVYPVEKQLRGFKVAKFEVNSSYLLFQNSKQGPFLSEVETAITEYF